LKGDKLVIKEGHIRASKGIMKILLQQIEESHGRFIISVAGESGSGKSEIASVISDMLSKEGIGNLILQQDDYFVYPPRTNAEMRKNDIGHVGAKEVRLDLLDENLRGVTDLKNEIEKPLVIFEEDRIDKETIDLKDVRVVIVEGTYTTILKNVTKHVFIDRNYKDTRDVRKQRAREEQDEFLEKILEIEHGIISLHKRKTDIIVTKDYEVSENYGEGN